MTEIPDTLSDTLCTETPEAPKNPERKHLRESVWEFLKFAAIAAIIVIPIRLYIAQPFIVSGASMVPTFDSGHYLIIDEVSYRFDEPRRGDVVVFRFPFEPSKFLIKRIAALPLETIEISGDEVRITNDAHPEGFVWEQEAIQSTRDTGSQRITLGDEEYFVLGDNRDASADSRIWGPLKREFIVGRPLIRILPLSKMGFIPGGWEEDGE